MRLGSDPEVFLQDANGSPVSSIGLIMADKWNPLQIPSLPEGYTLQEDNVSLEYGIPPAATVDQFVEHIQTVMLAGSSWHPGLTFSKLSCIIFPEDQMQSPMAHIFGCEPDFNAWDGKENRKPQPPHPFMRSAGGHVHIETGEDKERVIRNCDLFLSVPAVIMDSGVERKQLYGKAGAYRPKSYGVEYRSLSNFWIFEERLIRWVWAQTQRAVEYKGDVTEFTDAILDAVNNNNKEMAWSLVNHFNLEVV